MNCIPSATTKLLAELCDGELRRNRTQRWVLFEAISVDYVRDIEKVEEEMRKLIDATEVVFGSRLVDAMQWSSLKMEAISIKQNTVSLLPQDAWWASES